MNYKKKYKLDVINSLNNKDNFDVLKNKLNLKDDHIQRKENYFMKKSVVILSGVACVAIVAGVTTAIVLNSSSNNNKDAHVASLVTMDLNPSVSFLVDSNNKVVSVKGENNEGKMIIAGEKIEGKDLNEAIEIVLTIENETGYLVSGNARIEDNKLSFSITTDDEKIKESIKNTIDSTVSKVCDKLHVNETIAYVEAISRANLEKLALKCDPTLTEEDVKKMTYEQLFNVVKIYNIETAEIYSKELEELYNQVKEYDIKFAESEYTKDVISGMGKIYEIYMAGYDAVLQGLKSSIDYLNEIKYNNFVKEDCLYQNISNSYASAKEDLIKYKNQIASADVNDTETQERLTKLLDAQIKVVEGLQESLDDAVTAANKLIDGAIKGINSSIEALEKYKSKLPSQDEIEAKLAENAKTLENTINTKKDEAFASFEKAYGDDIKKAKDDVLAYKQSLKDSLKNNA